MDSLIHVMGTIWSSYLTAAVMVAALALSFALMTARWRLLAESYPAGAYDPPEPQLRDWAILASPYRYRDLVLPAVFTISERGLRVRTIAPLSWALAPMDLPFEALQLIPTTYGGDSEAWLIRTADHRDIDLIVFRDLKPWLMQHLPTAIRPATYLAA